MSTLAILAILGCGADPDWREQVAGWDYTEPIPDFALVDQDGQPFQLSRFADERLLVTFVYTRCPKAEACPLAMQKLVAVQDAWTGQILGLTLDPAYDSPERLKAFGDRFGVDWSRWTLATGPDELMSDALPSLFNVYAVPDANTLDHNLRVVVLEPGLTWGAVFKDNHFDNADLVDRRED